MHLHSSDVMGSSTRRAFSAFATALKGLNLHQQSCTVSSRVPVLRVGHQRALHAIQQQMSLHPHAHGCVRGVSSPRQLVRLLPGQCRGAALEVNDSADAYDRPSGADQDAGVQVLERVQSNAAASTSAKQQMIQPHRERITCDYTLLAACVHELRHRWLPAKVDQVIQADDDAVCLQLRFAVEEPAQAVISPSSDERRESVSAPAMYPWLAEQPGRQKGMLKALADQRGMVKGHLWLVWDTNGAARMVMGPPPERGAASEQFSFGAQMADELRGLILLDATLPKAWERVALLKFGARLGEPATHHVYLEVQGRVSNIVLTEARKLRDGWPIIAAGRQIGTKQSSQRQLQAQGLYVLPPLGQGLQPSLSDTSDVWRGVLSGAAGKLEEHYDALEKQLKGRPSIKQALVRAFQGVGPSIVADICLPAGIDPDLPVVQLQQEDWTSLYEQWQEWLLTVSSGNFHPHLDAFSGGLSVLGDQGAHQPGPESGDVRRLGSSSPAESVHKLLDQALRSTEVRDAFARKKHQLERAVKGFVLRMRNKMRALEQQQAATEKAEATRKQADLLTANLWKCKQGDKEVEVEDWETGQPVVIKLDPLKAPADTAEDLYKVARKQDRTGGAIMPIIQEVEEELEEVYAIDEQLQRLEAREEGAMEVLKGIQEDLVRMGIMKVEADAALAQKSAAQAARSARRRKEEVRKEFRMATSPNGLEVLIGRNNKENDRLSHKVAAKSDLWFHARGYPGSHTVLRIPSGSSAAEEDVAFAASCAAFFSKARNEGKVPVAKAFVSDLSKPTGAAPGKVMVMKEQVVTGRPAEAAAYFKAD